ncbi:phosphoribosylaminoimidazolecarboxamide formyltransferase / IMP cyclohydrolase [Pontimonas salivibrio]|uniref:Bifunctional purine biosynthesis protein PurH n=1 Tax=Pontimonas salivibrio TaxID=1159327 RepID=A0A2L2BNX6_9MICO|nr:bifunctional phosphoribosylaminoimidazolecarboxamide formyltransferase/IMP cyclohydrolase [Pontimonas salivibrio]AVG23369.1 phosphoribosylaminoimidazolecarboxamide formyltransferase / IMP cyclohydrolase [Pontimonas salivibrio]
MTEARTIRRALISVSDKTGLVELARALGESGVEIVSTGSTALAIRDAGVKVTDVAAVTGFAEALDGRVKTLHPSIHGGILADRRLESHNQQLSDLGIEPFDLVVVNLYPFAATVASGKGPEEVIENIDIGGPALIRAAAKNHHSVSVVVDPADYPSVTRFLSEGGVSLAAREAWAGKAYQHTASYDQMIAQWFASTKDQSTTQDSAPPEAVSVTGVGGQPLRYGENSHQSASVYQRVGATPGLAQATLLQGKEMSYNNFLDAEAALIAAGDHEGPAVAIIKHQNPCGIATAGTILEAYRAAHACDPVSAFGGVIALNRPLDADTAAAIADVFTEVIVAPGVSDAAREVLAAKKNLRVLVLPEGYRPDDTDYRVISGGLLVQQRDRYFVPADQWEQVAGGPVDQATMASLEFAWRAVKSVKSNAILLAADGASVGIGMGQVNRVDSCQLAVTRAGGRAAGSVTASDAFFPFADGLDILIAAGVAAVVQPGGSVRDEEVVARATAANIALFHTGQRHFLH